MAWLGFLIGLWVGAIVMALTIAIFQAGREFDRQAEGKGHGASADYADYAD